MSAPHDAALNQKVRPTSKVLLGLSGNALSSVVAALLRHQGFQVMGLHFKVDDAQFAEAERISKKLGITLLVEDAREAVAHYVIDHVVHQVFANRKPEPEVVGHQKILVDTLCRKAKELHCGKIATGHSARVALDPSTGLTRLLRGADRDSDQSHLLFGLQAEDLNSFILPVGDLGLSAVERLAIELELDPLKLKARPPGFCSIPEDKLIPLAEARIPAMMKSSGQIKTPDGTVLGEHDGLFKYVRGQSKGIPVAREDLGSRVVVDFNTSVQTLIVGEESLLLTREIVVGETNWIQPQHAIKGLVCEARLGHTLAKCRLTQFELGYVHVEFNEPQKNVIPGQAIVFYAGDEVLGGGYAV